MSFSDRFCPTNQYSHMLSSVERFEQCTTTINERLVHPIGREMALQQAGQEVCDAFAKVTEILIGKLRREATPESVAEANYFTDYYMRLGHGRVR